MIPEARLRGRVKEARLNESKFNDHHHADTGPTFSLFFERFFLKLSSIMVSVRLLIDSAPWFTTLWSRNHCVLFSKKMGFSKIMILFSRLKNTDITWASSQFWRKKETKEKSEAHLSDYLIPYTVTSQGPESLRNHLNKCGVYHGVDCHFKSRPKAYINAESFKDSIARVLFPISVNFSQIKDLLLERQCWWWTIVRAMSPTNCWHFSASRCARAGYYCHKSQTSSQSLICRHLTFS
jgi:hypothetical protein